jgi:glycosyltransferase involved in cell wall biosynthesis
MTNPKIAVVMPAYNAEKTLVKCYEDIPKGLADIVILVDDCSSDQTVAVARTLPITVIRHQKNLGYGGNQKTCYKEALRMGAEVVIMLHPDHQYDPKFIPEMVHEIVDKHALAVFGSRMLVRENALAGGMPYWKFFFNIVLTKIGNAILGTSLSEFHSGFRAYHKKVFELVDIGKNSDNFVFDTQMIIQLTDRHIEIKEIPISTRYFPEASQIGLVPSIRYGVSILYNLFLYKTKLRKF